MTRKSLNKQFKLLAADGTFVLSDKAGELGGNRTARIYGRLDCPSALAALKRGGYKKVRVFFLDEATAIAAGYRPCGKCLKERYAQWKRVGVPKTDSYPWYRLPRSKS